MELHDLINVLFYGEAYFV